MANSFFDVFAGGRKGSGQAAGRRSHLCKGDEPRLAGQTRTSLGPIKPGNFTILSTLAGLRVIVVLPGAMFRVELENKHIVLAIICGKMRKRFVRLTLGDRVKMGMSPYDLNKGRITWRLR